MLKADLVEAVIGLAPNLFYGAGIPAAVLIVRKNKQKIRRNKVLIVNGEATYQSGPAQNVLTDENVRTFVNAYREFRDVEKLAHLASLEEIAANDFSLSISRYVQTGADTESGDTLAEVAELKAAIAERDEAETIMFEHLKRLGYVS
jgi:type I restriction enzyme M protein